MDSIKKKMEKLASKTAEAEGRIAKYDEIKAGHEAEAEKYEEQVRNLQKKMQAMESQFDVCTEDLFNQSIKLEEMEKKAGNAENEVSALRSRNILLQENNEKQEERICKCLFVCFHTRSPGAGIIGSQGESQGLYILPSLLS